MMSAVCDGECNIGEHFAELLRCDPVIGIVAVVVVTVHRHNIGELKIGITAGIVIILGTHMVRSDRFLQVCFRGNDFLVRIDGILGVACAVGSIQCKFHVVSSSSSVK